MSVVVKPNSVRKYLNSILTIIILIGKEDEELTYILRFC